MKNRSLVFLISTGTLSVGFLIYFLFREDSILLNRWAHHLCHDAGFDLFQASIQHQQIPHWIKYSLPDGLWMASLMTFILLIWDFKFHFRSCTWIIIALASGLFAEAAQGLGWLRGIFDTMDVVFLFGGAFFPILLTLIKARL